jgi:hypothetical protein
MAERSGLIGRTAAVLARRLVFVALFMFGIGEAPLGGGDNAGARGALDAGRALAYAAGDTPLPTQFLSEDERGHAVKKGFGGGEDERSVAFARTNLTPPPSASGIQLQRAVTPAPDHGFSSRAPPALT